MGGLQTQEADQASAAPRLSAFLADQFDVSARVVCTVYAVRAARAFFIMRHGACKAVMTVAVRISCAAFVVYFFCRQVWDCFVAALPPGGAARGQQEGSKRGS